MYFLLMIIKLLTINKRLVQWADVEDQMREEQAGLRRRKSTIDQILILEAMI